MGEMMIAMRGKGRTEESREVQILGKDNKPLTIYYRQMGEVSQPSATLRNHARNNARISVQFGPVLCDLALGFAKFVRGLS